MNNLDEIEKRTFYYQIFIKKIDFFINSKYNIEKNIYFYIKFLEKFFFSYKILEKNSSRIEFLKKDVKIYYKKIIFINGSDISTHN